jgi:ABC-type sugar transport system ATPase subunit
MSTTTISAPGLQLRNVVKRFGDITVVQQLDLDVHEGEFVVLLGESGCGKSTTLRMIAGLEEVTEGQIMIAGREVTNIAPMARDIAMVFQNYALYPHMDVAQNMSFALSLAGRPDAEVKTKVQAAARILNIEHLLQRKPKELSGGQRQRVAIGRAIVREPRVFLFDEPLSNLDAKLRGHMRAELALLHERLGKTTVYVTHDQVEAMTLANRIVIFDKGRIQQVGTPGDVFNRPQTLFVAAFIGTPSMNLLDARFLEGPGPGSGQLQGEGFALPAPDWLRDRLKTPGQALTVGIRPQVLRPVAASDAAKPALILLADVVEYLGTESQVVGMLQGAGSQRITATLPGDAHSVLHSPLGLVADAADLHVFDTASGQSLRP